MIKGAYFVVNDHRINRIVWCGAAEPVLLKYGEDARLTFPSSQLLGSNEMEQLICQAHFKLPADGVGFGWHQDSDHRRYGTDQWTDLNGRGSFVQTLMAVSLSKEVRSLCQLQRIVEPASPRFVTLSMNTPDISAVARHLFETQGAKAIAEAAQKATSSEKDGGRGASEVLAPRVEAALLEIRGPRQS